MVRVICEKGRGASDSLRIDADGVVVLFPVLHRDVLVDHERDFQIGGLVGAMKRIFQSMVRILGALVLVWIVLWVALVKDRYIQVNSMTGASRSKVRYAYVYETPWNIQTTWVAESAKLQSINTDAGWRTLSHVAYRLGSIATGCSRAPVSYLLRSPDPEYLGLETSAQVDAFTREFVAASEERRKEMLVPH